MKRSDFIKTFTATPLAFVNKEQLEKLQKEDSVAFIMTVGGVKYGLAFKVDEMEEDLMVAFRSLVSSAEHEFLTKLYFKRKG